MQLASGYLWFKALHVAFMVTWFAGLFYLPRLFIYHTEATDEPGDARFAIMERRLYAIMTIGAVLTAIFGFVLLIINPALLGQDWFRVKLLLLAGLVIYHFRCRGWIKRLREGQKPPDTKWLRWFNEIPVIFLLGMICMAVVKPF
ncbi:MAG: CopD family protein [Gammaproteobacteria bacterium]|nr:CopD family protein [Gammaproteobacteria bacterium]